MGGSNAAELDWLDDGLPMINCQFIFKPGVYDDDFRALDAEIDSFARSLPGFRAVEMWQTADGSVVNASYGDGRLPHVTPPPES